MYYHNRIIGGAVHCLHGSHISTASKAPQAYGQNAKHAASDLDLGKEVTV